MCILTTCTKEIKTSFSKFDVCVSSDYEDCRLRGYDPVWPGINLLTCRRKVLSPYYPPETSVNFYHIARRHLTADFNINNLSVVFIWFLANLWLLFATQMQYMEKSHLHVGLPLWFPGLDLVHYEHWKCSQEEKQCFTASSQQTVYISHSFPGG
jgi:hypothetical protein